MNNKMLNRMLVILLAVLFIGSSIIPSISSDNNNEIDTLSLTFYTFDKTGTKKCNVELSTDVVNIISDMFEELKYKISCDSNSDEIKSLKNDFVEMLDINGLIPQGLSKDYVYSLLNPKRLQWIRNNVLPMQSSNIGSAVICSMTGGGKGLIFTPIIFPRPRFLTVWSAYSSAVSTAANLITGRGFVATGSQTGVALGFWGIGLSFAIPGEPATFGFGGYALLTLVRADDIEIYPLNKKPVISDENPSDDKWDASVSLSELSFRISDADGDRMSYWVTTDPDIGTGEAHLKNDGVYSVDVGGLEYDKSYSWTVKVSDGKDTVEKQFGFITEMGPPFDPFDEGWQYCKRITIDHNMVAGNLENFPILISMVDTDLRDKAQFDGDDILFMDDKGVANKLYHEIERYDGSSGELTSWVKISNLNSVADSVVYIYYGNSGCSSQEFPERIWDSNYCGVWHLNNFDDSTFNSYDGVNHGTDDSLGKIGFGKDFNSAKSDYIDWGDMEEPSNNNIKKTTFQLWLNPGDIEGSNPFVVKFNSGDYEPDKASYFFSAYNGNIIFRVYSGTWFSDGKLVHAISDNSVLNSDNWQHIAVVVDLSTKNIDIYYNGIKIDSTLQKEGESPGYFYDVDLSDISGQLVWEGATQYLDGIMDELRISKICRSPEWILTEFNNQNNPLDFYIIGPEESAP